MRRDKGERHGAPDDRGLRRLLAEPFELDAFAPQQRALDLEPVLPAPPGVTAVAADRPVGGDDPMARDEQADRIPADRTAHSTRRPWRADPSSDVAIARRRAEGDASDLPKDVAGPGGPVRQVDFDGLLRRTPGEQRFERLDRDVKMSPARL